MRKNYGIIANARLLRALDAVVENTSGNSLPVIALDEAHKMSVLKDEANVL